jgi:DNA-binding GntR family transcriptional regulator
MACSSAKRFELDYDGSSPMKTDSLVRGLREQIADRLRDDILTGRFVAGEKLAETKLVKRFGVSRAPIREALVRLTQEGLLVAQANRGVRVAPPAPDAIQELILPTRRTIETYALKLFFDEITEDDFRTWDVILERLREACSAGDPTASAEADIAFHRSIIERAGQADLRIIWSAIVGRLRDYFRRGHMNYKNPLDLYEEHRLVVEAFRSGDKDKAVRALEGNIGEPSGTASAKRLPRDARLS